MIKPKNDTRHNQKAIFSHSNKLAGTAPLVANKNKAKNDEAAAEVVDEGRMSQSTKTTQRLLAENGLRYLRNEGPKLKFRGVGHEFRDLEKLLQFYQLWSHQLLPKFNFKDSIEMMEKECKRERVNIAVQTWKEMEEGIKNPNDDDNDEDSMDAEYEYLVQHPLDFSAAPETRSMVDNQAEHSIDDTNNEAFLFPSMSASSKPRSVSILIPPVTVINKHSADEASHNEHTNEDEENLMRRIRSGSMTNEMMEHIQKKRELALKRLEARKQQRLVEPDTTIAHSPNHRQEPNGEYVTHVASNTSSYGSATIDQASLSRLESPACPEAPTSNPDPETLPVPLITDIYSDEDEDVDLYS